MVADAFDSSADALLGELAIRQILSHIWGFDFDPGSNVVDVYIRRLRRKLATDRIETVRGVGYRLSEELSGPEPA